MTKENIDEILNKESILLLDFWADWCGPCILMNPILEEFTKANSEVAVSKINADLNPGILRKYQVKGIPQFILLEMESKLEGTQGQ